MLTGNDFALASPAVTPSDPKLLERQVHAVASDLREVHMGSMFVACRIDRDDPDSKFWPPSANPTEPVFDNRDHIADALRRGASTILTDAAVPAQLPEGILWLKTHSPIEVMASLAPGRLEMLRTKVVGVTGSSGKSTTWYCVASMLSAMGAGVKPIGLQRTTPLSLGTGILDASARSSVASAPIFVVEYQSDHVGCLDRLASIAKPTIAAVLNVRPAHIHRFGSIGAIAAEKLDLVRNLAHDGFAVLNADEILTDWLTDLRSLPNPPIWFGLRQPANIMSTIRKIADDHSDISIQMGADEVSLRLYLTGASGVYVGLCAATICLALGYPLAQVARALAAFRPLPGRMSWRTTADGKIKIFDNTAKTNTVNLAHLAESASTIPWNGPRAIVLGGCGFAEHPAFDVSVASAIAQAFQYIILVGEDAEKYKEYFRKIPDQYSICYCSTFDETSEYVRSITERHQKMLFLTVVGSYRRGGVSSGLSGLVDQLAATHGLSRDAGTNSSQTLGAEQTAVHEPADADRPR
ncbi:MAG: hypothetical protein H6873_01185 [Hyphomicrobiaceae bacterium]|nr:hypothetical protein [Hyphomicrobiaceae bacterium]